MASGLKFGLAAGLNRLSEIRERNRDRMQRRQEQFDSIFGSVILPAYLKQKQMAAAKESQINQLVTMGIDRDVAVAYTANPAMFPGAEDDLTRLRGVKVDRSAIPESKGPERDVISDESTDPMQAMPIQGPDIAQGESPSIIDRLAGRKSAADVSGKMMGSTASLFGMTSGEVQNMFRTVYGAQVLGPQPTPGIKYDYEAPIDVDRVKKTFDFLGVEVNEIDAANRDAAVRAANSGNPDSLREVLKTIPSNEVLEARVAAARREAEIAMENKMGRRPEAMRRFDQENAMILQQLNDEVAAGKFTEGSVLYNQRLVELYKLISSKFSAVNDSAVLAGANRGVTPSTLPEEIQANNPAATGSSSVDQDIENANNAIPID